MFVFGCHRKCVVYSGFTDIRWCMKYEYDKNVIVRVRTKRKGWQENDRKKETNKKKAHNKD